MLKGIFFLAQIMEYLGILFVACLNFSFQLSKLYIFHAAFFFNGLFVYCKYLWNVQCKGSLSFSSFQFLVGESQAI